ncbi:MAG: YdcF family protein [Bacteroidales bacterium]|nr:YdcF family protein [Bacteroidales bacterium]
MHKINKVYINSIFRVLLKLAKGISVLAGILAIFMILISFTTLPYKGIYWLGTSALKAESTPEYIVVMGGSAMPGKSGLIRTYYAAMIAKKLSEAKIIIALPGDIYDTNSSIRLMQKELEIRNIDPDRIIMENKGKNTRFQALEIKKIIPGKKSSVLIVTSPEHMRRAIRAFEKTGFQYVNGIPAFDAVHDFELIFKDEKLAGKNRFLPEIGNNTQIRYQFWKHLEYEIIFIREIVALGFYNLKGWI